MARITPIVWNLCYWSRSYNSIHQLRECWWIERFRSENSLEFFLSSRESILKFVFKEFLSGIKATDIPRLNLCITTLKFDQKDLISKVGYQEHKKNWEERLKHWSSCLPGSSRPKTLQSSLSRAKRCLATWRHWRKLEILKNLKNLKINLKNLNCIESKLNIIISIENLAILLLNLLLKL